MIRIMLVDDHAAVRAGLQAVLEPEIDLVAVAATDGNEQLGPRFRRTCPDLARLDYHLPGQNSLLICGAMSQQCRASTPPVRPPV